MVSVSSFQKGVAATSLTPFLSELSAGTEMASYGKPQWDFLLAGGINVYVVPSENDDTNLLGSLLWVELSPAASKSKDNNGAAAAAAGFGMMLVSREARGQGVVKLLLNKAMNADERHKSEIPIRKLLPACSAMGQPVYSKLGFSSVGTVTGLRTEISKARNIPLEEGTNKCVNVKTFGSMDKDATLIDSKIRDLLIEMDSKATGYDRTNRLSFMLRNNVQDIDGVRTIVAVATSSISTAADDNDNKEIIGAAVIRREMQGGPFVVGPIIGSHKAVLPLVKAHWQRLCQMMPANQKSR